MPIFSSEPSKAAHVFAACGLPVAAAALALLFAGAGCHSRPALVRQTFALEIPRATRPAGTTGEGVLSVRACEVSPLFEGRSLVYRTAAETYELDSYASFLVPASRALAVPIRAALRNSGVFRDVVEPGSLLQPDRFLEVHVSEFYGDLRAPGRASSVLAMRLVVFRARAGAAPVVYFEKNYSRRIVTPDNTAASIVAGWNTALAEIMAEAGADLAAAKS